MIEPFDLIFYKGTNPVSKLISKVTGSPYTHVALALDEFHLVEADWYHPLAIRHIVYRTNSYDIFTIEGLTEEQKDRVKDFIYQTVNSGYDYKLVLSHLWHYFGGKLLNNPNRFDCSEWIDLAFLSAGFDLLPDTQISTVTPAELVLSPKIKRKLSK